MRVLESDPCRSAIDSDNVLNDADGSRVGTIEVQVRRLGDHRILGRARLHGYFDVDGIRRPIDEFDPAEHQNPANVGDWKDGWAIRGIYINNFVFLPNGQ